MRYIFTFLILILFFAQLIAQVRQTDRIEIPFKYSEENYLLATAGEKGIILFRESREKNQKKETWEILVLDTLLQEKLELAVEVDYKYSIIGYEYRSGYFYLLFDDHNSSKSDLYLVKIYIEDGSKTTYEITNELAMDASHLLINEKSIVLGGNINSRPTFIVFSYIDNKVQVVPGFFNTKSEVLDFNYDDNYNSYNVLMGQKNALNRNEITIKSFDHNGVVMVDEKHEFDKNWRALNGKLIISNRDQIVVSGSYAANNSYYSKGYYFGSLVPGKELSMKYINFTEIENFFNYMPPKRAEKIKSKINTAKNNSKTYEFKTQVYVHELREGKEEFILVSEIYKPEFNGAISSPTAMAYNGIQNQDYSNMTGQKYVSRSSRLTNTDGASHISYLETIILAIDKKGKLLWNQSLSLNDVETLALEQVSRLHKKGENGLIIHKKENALIYRSFDIDHGILVDSTVAINTFKDFDKVSHLSENQGRVQYWYDNNFIAWGYQKIINEHNLQIGKKRNIFFINKLLIE